MSNILLIVVLVKLEKLSTMGGMKNSLKSAIKSAGGLSAFAEAVGASSTHAVRAWFLSRVPAEYCPAIEKATGVRCEELRPDVQWGVLRQSETTKEVAHG
jgi:DNA-binding transcriptional regulator YdaS (Cro superfamily)